MTWDTVSFFGFRRIGFMWLSGVLRQAALAWTVWAMAISVPMRVALAFRLMFWLLNGATRCPFLCRILHIAATVTDFPASEVAPTTIMALPSR